MALIAGGMETWQSLRAGEAHRLPRRLLLWSGVPIAIAALIWWLAPMQLPLGGAGRADAGCGDRVGPLLYRIAYQPLAEASVLVLLIVSVALHFAMVGFGLWFFGAEGSRTPAFSSASFAVGGVNISVQSLLVVVPASR